MSRSAPARQSSRETWVGWSAIATATLAVLSWASCCVLPLALSLAGLSLSGSGIIAGQRIWTTLLAFLVVGGGWVLVLRRAQRCKIDKHCAAPSRFSVWLLGAATILIGVSLIWTPVIEPAALHAIGSFRR